MIINQTNYGKGMSGTAIAKDVLYKEIGYTVKGKIVGEAPITINNDIYKFLHRGEGIKLTDKSGQYSALLMPTDNDVWTESTLPLSKSWDSICYGNGVFVSVAYASGDIIRSEDGITWTLVTPTLPSGKTLYYMSVCYGNGKFVAVSYNYNIYTYSEDGINWTEGQFPADVDCFRSICYGGGKFVAVSTDHANVMYSEDGITWGQSTLPSSRVWCSVCYGNGKYVAVQGLVSSSTNIYDVAAYSEDGITWTEITLPIAAKWQSVCYGNGKFVAVNWDAESIAYSEDGINWTLTSTPSGNYLHDSVCYGDNRFVVVGGASDAVYSEDGINWKEYMFSSSISCLSLCYGEGKFVAMTYDKSLYLSANYYIINL